MVYLYKKLVRGRPYYYLRASERKGKRVVAKDIAYLGNSIEDVKKNLEKKEFKEEVRKAYRTIHVFLESNYWLEKAMKLKLRKNEFLDKKLEVLEACRLHFENYFQNLGIETKREIFKQFLIEFAFNTTSIEGNTINLEEAKNLLEEGLTPKNKTLREIYDLKNTEKVFFELLHANDALTHELIVKIHDGLMENIDARKGYRRTDVRVVKSNFDATPAPYVKTDMDLLLKWYNQNKSKIHPFVLAVIFHHKFEKIHPFMDGNGRTGRMILNYILIKNRWPPLIIYKKTRKEYLEALRIADKGNLTQAEREDYLRLIEFSADEMIAGYWNLFL
jgi:Fic family protein